VNLRTTITYVNSPQYTAQQFNNALRAGNSAAVEYWNVHFTPLHFTEQAFTRYAYQHRLGQDEPEWIPRDVASKDERTLGRRKFRMIRNPHYYWIKKRQGFGTLPLVRTGRSESATAPGNIKITATPKRGTGTFPFLPRYFYQYRTDLGGGRTPIDKADELVRVTIDEVTEMGKAHREAMLDFLDTMPVRREYEVLSL
jgi:hypothetical protein